MSCESCEKQIEEKLSTVSHVSEASVDHETGTIEVNCDDDVPIDEVHAAIEQAGFDIVT